MVIPKLKSLRVNRLDFESIQVIGKGRFGDVELVIEKHTKDNFAMKVLKKHNFLGQKDVLKITITFYLALKKSVEELKGTNLLFQISLFEFERDIMASSSSPFLTQLYYAFQDYQNLYLIMDYHPGGDFGNLISNKFNGTLPEEAAKY